MNQTIHKSKNFFLGFKQFINKGNVIHLAIAFIMGQLFNKIVASLSSDIIMPLVNLLVNTNVNLDKLKYQLKGDIFINYGIFLQTIGDFLITTLFIYIILIIIFKQNKESKESALESLNKKQIKLLTDIKDLLTNK